MQDRKIQVEVELIERGAQADVDNFKNIYEARYATPENCCLSGGSSKNYPITKQNKKTWKNLTLNDSMKANPSQGNKGRQGVDKLQVPAYGRPDKPDDRTS